MQAIDLNRIDKLSPTELMNELLAEAKVSVGKRTDGDCGTSSAGVKTTRMRSKKRQAVQKRIAMRLGEPMSKMLLREAKYKLTLGVGTDCLKPLVCLKQLCNFVSQFFQPVEARLWGERGKTREDAKYSDPDGSSRRTLTRTQGIYKIVALSPLSCASTSQTSRHRKFLI
jgi:hypothetical protein